MVLRRAIWATLIGTAILAVPAAAEAPKYGGTLTYMIPADAPPSFDGHRESTYATVHSVAPFYSDRDRGTPRGATHRVTGGGRPPPVPTERSVQISRTTLFRR